MARNMAVITLIHLTRIVVCGIIVCQLINLQRTNALSEEPTCYSRFDYDMKMFETVAGMKIDHKTMLDTVNKLHDLIETLEKRTATQYDAINKLETVLAAQKETIQKLEAEGNTNDNHHQVGGNTYVRWGRTSCPDNGTTLVYKGIMGGPHYSQSGSGANYQCLPDEPSWDKYQDGAQSYRSYMYGAEYEAGTVYHGPLKNTEIPCAVCLTSRSTVLMIPAMTSCYPGWTMEYRGNLASSYYSYHRAQYICVDRDAVSAPGSKPGNEDGALIHDVEARCGSLPCPPYVDGRELACVVCSK